MRVGLYNGTYFGIQFTEIDKFCCYKKEGSDLQSLYRCQYFLASTSVLTGKY